MPAARNSSIVRRWKCAALQRRPGSHAFDRYRANAVLRQKHRGGQAHQAASRNENRHFRRAGFQFSRRSHENALCRPSHIGFWNLSTKLSTGMIGR
jgi:hypothetical protein